MSNGLYTLTRAQIDSFIKNDPRAVRAIERAVTQANVTIPDEIDAILSSIESATARANEAISSSESLESDTYSDMATIEARVQSSQDIAYSADTKSKYNGVLLWLSM